MESWLLWVNTIILIFLLSPTVIGWAFHTLVFIVIILLFIAGVLGFASFETYQNLDNETREKIKKFLRDHTRFNIE